MFDIVREIAQTLRNNKLRTTLTGFAVAWGIFMLIVLLGMSRGVYNNFTSWVSAENSNSLSIWGGTTMQPHKGYKEGRAIELEETDKRAIITASKHHVENAFAIKQIDSAKVSTSKDYLSNGIYGHFPSEQKRAKLTMIYGRFLNQPDLDEKRKVMVLEKNNAITLFGDAAKAIGQQVNALGLSWKVIGVYSHDWENGTYAPFSTIMSLSGNDGIVSSLYVTIKNVETTEDGSQAEKEVKQVLSATHNFNPDDESAVYIWNRFNNYLRNIQATNILSMAVWIIGLLTLLSGIVGVSNIMFVSVRERTHEIGIRRAIGAKPRSILIQIVLESISITTLFGYIGIVVGTIVIGTISTMTQGMDFIKNPSVDLSTALNVTIVLIIAGAFAGLFPAIKATKIKPVEALRDE